MAQNFNAMLILRVEAHSMIKNHCSKERIVAALLMVILDLIIVLIYKFNMPIFILAPIVIFNAVIIGVILSSASDAGIKLYITQIEAMIIAFLLVWIASKINDNLCILVAVIYIAYAFWFYKSKIQVKK